MPIPRFVDKATHIRYEMVLFCPDCGWAITKDRLTCQWEACRYCGSLRLETRRINYNY